MNNKNKVKKKQNKKSNRKVQEKTNNKINIVINIIYGIISLILIILAIIAILKIKYGNIPQVITFFVTSITICPLINIIFNKKKSFNFYIIQAGITFILLIIGIATFGLDGWHFNLDKKIEEKTITYMVSSEWREEQEQQGNVKARFYYPFADNDEIKIIYTIADIDKNVEIDEKTIKETLKHSVDNEKDIKTVKTEYINGYKTIFSQWCQNIDGKRVEFIGYSYTYNASLYMFKIRENTLSQKTKDFFNKFVNTITIKSINISNDKNILNLVKGTEEKVEIKFKPDNYSEKYELKSDNESIIVVENEKIKAVGNGKSKLKVISENGLEDEIEINVTTKTESIVLDKAEVTLHVDEKAEVHATVMPVDTSYGKITWKSSDNSIATVENGIITSKKIGKAKITATTEDNKSAECTVNVINLTKDEYKALCNSYSYEELFRNSSELYGNFVKVTGEVVQVIRDSYSTSYRVDITKNGTYYTYWTDTIYVTTLGAEEVPKILEKDIVTIYGQAAGEYSYTSVLKSTITLPKITAKYIEIN